MSGTESASIAHHILRTARHRGVDIAGLEDRFGVSLDEPVDVIRRMPLDEVYSLWEALLARTSDPSLAFQVAAEPFPEAIALFVFVTTSRQTVADALRVLVTYSPVVTDVTRFELVSDAANATLRMSGPDVRRPGAYAAAEFLAGHVVRAVQHATSGRCRPSLVSFAHPDASAGRRLPEFLGKVRFSAPASIIEFPRAALDLRIDVMGGLEQILASRAEPPTIVVRARQAIALAIAAGAPVGIEVIARELGLAPRTLQRHLRGESSFQKLTDDAQRELAVTLIRTRPELSLKEIAARVGFASARSFSRAYARWTGEPPKSTRARTR